MYLLVGLGNPGKKYAATRHNVGFIILDRLAAIHGLHFENSRWRARLLKTRLWNREVLFCRPETFMNLSGEAVAGVAGFYKIPPHHLLVVHDDLDLAPGRVKITASGGDGGHRGIRSIIDRLGSRDFARLKVGIGRPDDMISPERYVLDEFQPQEESMLAGLEPLMLEGIELFVREGVQAAMNRVNQRPLAI